MEELENEWTSLQTECQLVVGITSTDYKSPSCLSDNTQMVRKPGSTEGNRYKAENSLTYSW